MLDLVDTLVASTVLIVLTVINVLLIIRRRSQGIKSLENLIMIFSAMQLMALMQLIHVITPGLHPMFDVTDTNDPVIMDPIRWFNLLFIIGLYFFAEYTINPSVNKFRSLLLTALAVPIIVIGVIDLDRQILVLTSDVLPFAQDVRFDELFFDLIQLFVISFTSYVFYLQQAVTQSPQLRRYARLLLSASLLYTGAMVIEVLEQFIPGLAIDAFLTAIPAILLLGYTYLANPRFVYLVPTDIKFLQIVDRGGTTIYAAEFMKEANNIEFLVGPGLFSISTMLSELIRTSDPFELDTIHHSHGTIIFTHYRGLIGVVQTQREAKFLRDSLRYFLREFARVYNIEKDRFTGTLQGEIGPDILLARCVPIVESRPIISQIRSRANSP